MEIQNNPAKEGKRRMGETEKEKGETYVTYKWLMVQGLVLLGIALGFIYFTNNSYQRLIERMDCEKVDIPVYEERTKTLQKDVDTLKNQTAAIANEVNNVKFLALENKSLNEMMLEEIRGKSRKK